MKCYNCREEVIMNIDNLSYIGYSKSICDKYEYDLEKKYDCEKLDKLMENINE